MQTTPSDTAIHLHPMDASQKPAFWQLYKRCYEPTIRKQFGDWDDAGHYYRFEEIWQQGKLHAIEFDGLLIGCLGFSEQSDYHELIEIQIDPTYQNRGIATHLIRWLIARAEEEKKPLYLNVFLASDAIRLYERLGFGIVESTEAQHRMVYMSKGL